MPKMWTGARDAFRARRVGRIDEEVTSEARLLRRRRRIRTRHRQQRTLIELLAANDERPHVARPIAVFAAITAGELRRLVKQKDVVRFRRRRLSHVEQNRRRGESRRDRNDRSPAWSEQSLAAELLCNRGFQLR